MTNFKTAWNPKDWQRAKQLRAEGLTDSAIAEELGFDEERVRRKFYSETHLLPHQKREHPKRGSAPSPQAEADRERRHQAWLKQTGTGAILGDPPPGFSELDKRR